MSSATSTPPGSRAAKSSGPKRTEDRIRRVVALGLAAMLGLFVEIRARDAAHLRDQWGADRRVLVVMSDLPAGHVLEIADVIDVNGPEAVLPEAALDVGTDVAGVALARAVSAGAVLTSLDVAGSRTGPDESSRWMSLPIDETATPPLFPGDRVDVVSADPFEGGASYVATNIAVVDLGEGAVVVEVSAAQAAELTSVLVTGVIVIVLAAR